MYCLIYSRVSTEDQAETGRSIGDQIKICKRFSDENGYDVAGIYKDEGKSATNMNRAGLQDMIIKCQEDKNIEAILVQDTDRLARNTSDHLQIKAMLKKVGTQVISVSQPMLDDTTPEGQFMDLVIAGVNAFQSKITGRKVSKCMLEKFRDGWWPAAAPFGYTNINVGTEEKPVNVIGDDETKQTLITKAFETFAKGMYSAVEVNSMFFKQGLSTRSGKKPSSSEFNRILKNSFYYGLMKWQGEEKMGNHKPIVTKKFLQNIIVWLIANASMIFFYGVLFIVIFAAAVSRPNITAKKANFIIIARLKAIAIRTKISTASYSNRE
jgi:site-specific DNA recombinase